MALIFILLYAPIVTLVVLSFNASKTRAKWGGFTLHWYRSLFANTEIMNALYTTLIIALLASAIATILGTLACIGINSMSKKSRTLFMGITNIPMLNSYVSAARSARSRIKKKPDAFHGYYEHPDAER